MAYERNIPHPKIYKRGLALIEACLGMGAAADVWPCKTYLNLSITAGGERFTRRAGYALLRLRLEPALYKPHPALGLPDGFWKD